jgi:glycosyltransferase involved in cell wall biosynthesis
MQLNRRLTDNKLRPTVVVVIPYYNGSKFIERSVRSAYDQDVPADEVIVVNDGSIDSERAFLHELATKYPFRIVDKENGGQGSARNAGVAASTSDYICFLDQDDFFLPNHIEDLVGAMPEKDRRFGFVYADLCHADGDGNIIYFDTVRNRGDHPKRSIIQMIGADMFVLPSASLIGRKAFDAVGGFDPQFTGYEDDDLFLRLFRAGYNNYFLAKSVTVWCIHSASTSYSIQMTRSRFKYFRKLAETFPDAPAQGYYYFRDLLRHRFQKMFIDEANKAVNANSEHQEEVCDMLKTYTAMVCKNPHVARRSKLRLRFVTFSVIARSRLRRAFN